MAQYKILPEEEEAPGTCDCCGSPFRRVWGFVRYGDATLACYFVTWAEKQLVKHGANWDFILGSWDDRAVPEERIAVSLAMRLGDKGPEFMVLDANDRDMDFSKMAAKAMTREEVVETKLAEAVFGMLDAIWSQDARLTELSG